jgi:hypothetical protein
VSKPIQPGLPFPREASPAKASRLSKRETLDTLNDASAVVILAHIAEYGGEDSLMVRWAREYQKRKGMA